MPVLVPRTRHHLVHLQPCTVKIRSKGVLQSRPQYFRARAGPGSGAGSAASSPTVRAALLKP
jgi:hypothetical protein